MPVLDDLREYRYSSGLTVLAGFSAIILFTIAAAPMTAQTVLYPLDGLTAPELWAAIDALKASGHVDAKTSYPLISLHEPPKEEVLAWRPGQTFRREALVVVKQGASTFEAVVDV